MKRPRPFLQILLWSTVAAVLTALIAVGIFTNITLRSVEKNLPNTLLEQLHDLALILEDLSEVVSAAELAKAVPSSENCMRLRKKVMAAQISVIKVRDTYVVDNLIQASAFHAVVAPAIADLQLWLSEGISGYAPQSDVTIDIVLSRISEVFQKAKALNQVSEIAARKVLDEQRNRLDRFLFSVNLLFSVTLVITFIMVFLLIRQQVLQRREIEAQAERRRIQEELHESEEKYRRLFETSAIGFFLLTDVFVDCNEQACRLLRCSREDIVGHSPAEFSPAQQADGRDSTEATHEHIQAAFSGQRQQFYWIHRRKDDTLMDAEITLQVLPIGGRQMLVATLVDITDRKQMEEALRESEENYRQLYAEAKQAAEVYRSLLGSSADAIVIYDLEGNVQFLSPSFTQIFGWTLEELAGKRIPFVPDSEREATMAEVHRVLEGNPCSNFATRRCDKDGRILNITLSASRFDDHEGMPAGMLVILRDVTHTKAMEAQYLQAQKMEAVGTLAGGVAHDFNNLLQAIGGFTELLLLAKSANDPDHSSLMQIKKACDRAAQLIQQLLAFSRKAEGVRHRLDLNQEVVEAEKLLQRTLPKMTAIELHLAGYLWSVHADPVQIEQILLNLGSNAADAMPDGGRLIIETLNASLNEDYCRDHLGAVPGDYVLLSVSDTGRGMDRETLQHIFEPFFTTKGVGKGTGLGLASVYGIVKGLGGHLTCYSEPGQGTIFRIYLPAVEQVEDQAEGGVDETPLKGGSETILVVDDEAAVRDVATQILQHFGYDVLVADSGETALELYKNRKAEIDLVILDLGMPGMGGHKCLRELRAIEPSAKVVVASGYSINGQVRASLESGAGGFVGKPYQLKDLVTTVRKVLDGKRG
jgi:two-component system, cell cycle sensor histidine kinase and response regulator CckA